jgi:hypothetical protein
MKRSQVERKREVVPDIIPDGRSMRNMKGQKRLNIITYRKKEQVKPSFY